MQKRNNFTRFGEKVTGHDTLVLNEREIRAAAGILFLVMFLSLVFVLFQRDFFLIKFVIVGFFVDFSIRVLINPRYSPTLVMGRLIVSRQMPEYVGAPQKKFAWTIGLCLSGVMFILLVLLNAYSLITGLVCLLCLTFLFFETAFGICLGCLFYPVFYQKKAQQCAGALCEKRPKETAQTVSRGQLLGLLSYFVFILLIIYFFKEQFHQTPTNLWDLVKN